MLSSGQDATFVGISNLKRQSKPSILLRNVTFFVPLSLSFRDYVFIMTSSLLLPGVQFDITSTCMPQPRRPQSTGSAQSARFARRTCQSCHT